MKMSFLTPLKQTMSVKIVLLAFSAFGLVACGSSVDLNPGNVSSGADIDATQTEGSASAQNVGGSGTLDESARNNQVASVQSQSIGDNDIGPPNTDNVVYFDLDSYVIAPPYQKAVAAHANYLNAHRDHSVVLEGHTDERGGREYNLALGQKRAEAVMLALRVLGVQANQIEAVSFGEESPADPGNDESAWAKNRRVVIRYR